MRSIKPTPRKRPDFSNRARWPETHPAQKRSIMKTLTKPQTAGGPVVRAIGRIRDHEEDDSQRDAVLNEMFAGLARTTKERRAAVAPAQAALARLCDVMRSGTNQSYHVRAMLFSLYNGKPASLIEVLSLDWAIRQDVCAVILAFGFEEPGTEFFYGAMKAAVTAAGLWDWFIARSEEVEP